MLTIITGACSCVCGGFQETIGSDENVGTNKVNLSKVFADGVHEEWFDMFSEKNGARCRCGRIWRVCTVRGIHAGGPDPTMH